MIELPEQVPASVIHELVEGMIPQTIQKGTRLDIGIGLREAGLEFHALSHFLRITDRCYGHLSPGGIKRYLKDQDAKLKIAHMKHEVSEWRISKTISEPSEGQILLVLSVFLKCLPHLKTFSKMPLEQWGEASHGIQKNMFLAKNHIRIYKTIAEDRDLVKLSEGTRNHLSNLLSTLYLREYRLLYSASRFSKACVQSITLKVKTPSDNKAVVNHRVYLKRPIMATLIQDGRSYPSQMIEYSSNGAGLSLLVSDITQDKKGKGVQDHQDISVRIGDTKCTGSIIHQSQRDIGLFVGIQLRYPVQNWESIIN